MMAWLSEINISVFHFGILFVCVLALYPSGGDAVHPAKIYGENEADPSMLAQGAYIFFLSPKASRQVLTETTQRVAQLETIVPGFRVNHRWDTVNAFVVTSAGATLARLIAEMPDVEFGAIVDMGCGTTGTCC